MAVSAKRVNITIPEQVHELAKEKPRSFTAVMSAG